MRWSLGERQVGKQIALRSPIAAVATIGRIIPVLERDGWLLAIVMDDGRVLHSIFLHRNHPSDLVTMGGALVITSTRSGRVGVFVYSKSGFRPRSLMTARSMASGRQGRGQSSGRIYWSTFRVLEITSACPLSSAN